jgi:hypothetical protein
MMGDVMKVRCQVVDGAGMRRGHPAFEGIARQLNPSGLAGFAGPQSAVA